MNDIKNNYKYQELLKFYHELKEKIKNLEKNKDLFEHEIILDSGTIIHPAYSSEFYKYREQKHETLEQLLDICVPVENIELKNRTDIVSQICSFSKWGLYFFCIFQDNSDFKYHLMTESISFYQNKNKRFKQPMSKELIEERKLFLNWLLSLCRFKNKYDLRGAAFNNCFDGEKYLIELFNNFSC